MKLEEARNEAELLEGLVDYGQGYPPHLSDGEEACIVLNHRITELEAQRDELEKIVVELGGVGALPTTVYASDKEDKG